MLRLLEIKVGQPVVDQIDYPALAREPAGVESQLRRIENLGIDAGGENMQ
jgi:hypothetical protein